MGRRKTPPPIPSGVPPAPSAMKPIDEDPSEASIEDKVCGHAERRGFWVRKFMSPNNRSEPDRIFKHFLTDVFWIEFKRKGKEATTNQATKHEKIREVGGRVYVCDNVDYGKWIIDLELDCGKILRR